MTSEQFDLALRSYCRRRPFVKFEIEFTSGSHLSIGHPEAVKKTGTMYVMRSPNRAFSVFSAESVTRLHD